MLPKFWLYSWHKKWHDAVTPQYSANVAFSLKRCRCNNPLIAILWQKVKVRFTISFITTKYMLCTLGGKYISYTLKEHKDFSSLWIHLTLNIHCCVFTENQILEKSDYSLPPYFIFPWSYIFIFHQKERFIH